MLSRLGPVLLPLLLAGCTYAMPSNAGVPEPVSTAAQPAVAGRGDVTYAYRTVNALRQAVSSWEPVDALSKIPAAGINVPEQRLAAACRAAPGEMAILVCHFGPTAAQPVGQAILWFDREGWQAQLYPQAESSLASERRTSIAEWNCKIGCTGGIRQARQVSEPDGTELLVVVDLGFGTPQRAEEVHLLTLTDGSWHLTWAPGGGDWNYGQAVVTLPAQGTQHFDVRSSSWGRNDMFSGYLIETADGEHRRFQERWIRKGTVYVMRDRLQEASPYGALVRLIHFLSSGADEKAQLLLARSVPLAEARRLLAQKPPRQGWQVKPLGENQFRLAAPQQERRTVQVRLEKRGSDWVVVAVGGAQS